MNTDIHFDAKKRLTLKLLTGITTTGLLAGLPALATAQFISPAPDDEILQCKLISRADLSRAYLLMHNKTNQPIAAAMFTAESIQFDGTTLNMADAYFDPVIIPSHDRVMVRLNLEAGLQAAQSASKLIDANNRTQYLPQGTRVVELNVRVNNGVATIDHHPIPA